MTRAKQCEATYDAARELAAAHGWALSNPSDGCYQLRHHGRDWLYNLYPRRGQHSPLIYGDLHHRGPFLDVPQYWTLLDVVQAAIALTTDH